MTERDLLDLLWQRYGTARSLGDAPRYIVAEHPRTALGDRKNSRVLDAIVMDRHVSYPKRPKFVRSPDGSWAPRPYDDSPVCPHPVLGFEVKVNRSDFLKERRDPEKARAWSRYCSEFYLLAPKGLVTPDELPTGWGLMVPSGSGLRAVRKATVVPQPEMMPQTVVSALMWAAMKTDRKHR